MKIDEISRQNDKNILSEICELLFFVLMKKDHYIVSNSQKKSMTSHTETPCHIPFGCPRRRRRERSVFPRVDAPEAWREEARGDPGTHRPIRRPREEAVLERSLTIARHCLPSCCRDVFAIVSSREECDPPPLHPPPVSAFLPGQNSIPMNLWMRRGLEEGMRAQYT